jgi:caffeoyl-CoA O-methyltransferase
MSTFAEEKKVKMDFLDPKADAYATRSTTPESEILQRLHRETHLRTHMPRMLSGHLQGRILSLFSKLVQPKLIVEIGTFTGYSALCLSEGLAPGGRLITLEINDEVLPIAEKYFREAGVYESIEMRVGNAAELIQTIEGPIDLAFIDADKVNYPAYWKLIFPKLRSGGIIIADNVLWSGKVFEPSQHNDPDTTGLLEFTEMALQEKDAEQVLLPVRDGLLVIRKK